VLDNIFQVIFLVGLVVYLFGVYRPNVRRYRKSRITDSRLTRLDLALDMLAFVAWQVIPVIYVLTPWLDFADYHLPTWTGWVGTAIFALALWLLWRSYADLGRNWSPTLQIMEEHSLVTHGVYQYVRHPIYAALWPWGIAQPLLLQNWIAGFALLAIFIPLYLLRVPREEQIMLEHFGEQYGEYVSRTRRVIPRQRR